jgi:inhibitor of cysteine peptidase
VIVTSADGGGTRDLKVGDTLVVELPETPSSGYRWALERLDEARLVLVDSAFRSGDDRPGAAGVATWTLKAVASGTTTVDLKRWRHWEGDRSIVERFGIRLQIQPA